MNNRYFVCTDCKTYVDACSRWCAHQLEDRQIVKWRQEIEVDRVLADVRYWDKTDPAFSGWELKLEAVRRFLVAHKDHGLVFLVDDDLLAMGDSVLLKWLDVGWMPKWTPRHFSDVLRMNHWSEGEAYVQGNTEEALWFTTWLNDEERDAFRHEFENQLALRNLSRDSGV